jgi:hypothetical protein
MSSLAALLRASSSKDIKLLARATKPLRSTNTRPRLNWADRAPCSAHSTNTCLHHCAGIDWSL